MLLESQIEYRVSGEWTIARHKRSGEPVSKYRRLMTPLELWRRDGGLRQTEYEAGLRYGALWREVCQPKSPPHSDPTRVIVDGGGYEGRFGDYRAVNSDELREAQEAIRDEETIACLNRLCGLEEWPPERRRFKRICRRGLQVLVELWRR